MKRWCAPTIVLFLAFASVLISKAAPGDFDFTTDPSIAVLQLRSDGGMSGIGTVYSLYGDGKLVWRRIGKFSPETELVETFEGYGVTQRHEATLSFEEMQALVGVAVETGLAVATPEDIESQMASGRSNTSDLGDMVFELHLESLAGTSGEAVPLNQELRLHAPTAAARQFPEITQLQGLKRIHEALNENLGFVSRVDQGRGSQ